MCTCSSQCRFKVPTSKRFHKVPNHGLELQRAEETGRREDGSVSAPRTAGPTPSRRTRFRSFNVRLNDTTAVSGSPRKRPAPSARARMHSPLACTTSGSRHASVIKPDHLRSHAVIVTPPLSKSSSRTAGVPGRTRPGSGHHKVPTSLLSASAIFRRSSKQRDECLNPMRAGEI